MNTAKPDRELIDSLGGPVKLASMLQLGRYGPQRVSNWKARGIPSAVKLKYPHLFLPDWAKAPTSNAQPATESVAGQGVANV
jgi:hypothetical protein